MKKNPEIKERFTNKSIDGKRNNNCKIIFVIMYDVGKIELSESLGGLEEKMSLELNNQQMIVKIILEIKIKEVQNETLPK